MHAFHRSHSSSLHHREECIEVAAQHVRMEVEYGPLTECKKSGNGALLQGHQRDEGCLSDSPLPIQHGQRREMMVVDTVSVEPFACTKRGLYGLVFIEHGKLHKLSILTEISLLLQCI